MFVSKYQLAIAFGALAATVSAQDTTNYATQSINTAVAATLSRPTGSVGGTAASVVSTEAPKSSSSSSSSSSATAPATVPTFDISAAPTSTLDLKAMTASSNFTLPKPDATAVWNDKIQMSPSVDYVVPQLKLAAMPDINYSLANETEIARQAICARQVQWCATAGCAEEGAKIKDNFCNVENLGSRCTCDKGLSNLDQYKWPVQFADCTGRATACAYQCMKPDMITADRTACRQACTDNLSSTCGQPGQFSANYAVSKDGQKPKLNMIQGGGANGAMGAFGKAMPAMTVVAVASVATLLLLA